MYFFFRVWLSSKSRTQCLCDPYTFFFLVMLNPSSPSYLLVHFDAVTVTLLNFIRLFRKAHEENCKQAELERKKAQKEVEMEKAKGINLTKKGVK